MPFLVIYILMFIVSLCLLSKLRELFLPRFYALRQNLSPNRNEYELNYANSFSCLKLKHKISVVLNLFSVLLLSNFNFLISLKGSILLLFLSIVISLSPSVFFLILLHTFLPSFVTKKKMDPLPSNFFFFTFLAISFSDQIREAFLAYFNN